MSDAHNTHTPKLDDPKLHGCGVEGKVSYGFWKQDRIDTTGSFSDYLWVGAECKTNRLDFKRDLTLNT